MKNHTNLTNKLYDVAERAELQQLSVSRTLQQQAEVTLRAELFCQPIDIAIELTGNTTQSIANMERYPLRSQANAIAYMRSIQGAGIRTVMLRMNAPKSFKDVSAVLKRQAAIVRKLRQQFDPTDLAIIVDPFSIALNDDKTWGIQTNGQLNYLKTIELFASMSQVFAKAGASYMLTLGRFEREVDATTRAIAALPKAITKVASFSTNTETTNAYVYADHGAYAITKQKILVSNYQEMTLRALIDIYEGSNFVVVKPAENLHVLERLSTLLKHPDLLQEFLASPVVAKMTEQSVYLRFACGQIQHKPQLFLDKAATVRLGAYTVSGTYFSDIQILNRRGAEFLKSVLYERFCNIASVLESQTIPGLIIDRNAAWYFGVDSQKPSQQ